MALLAIQPDRSAPRQQLLPRRLIDVRWNAANSDAMTREERREMRDNALVGYVPALNPREAAPKHPRGRRVGRSSVL